MNADVDVATVEVIRNYLKSAATEMHIDYPFHDDGDADRTPASAD